MTVAQTRNFRPTTRWLTLLSALLAPDIHAISASITLDNADPASTLHIEGAELIQTKEGVKIDKQTYLYFMLKFSDALLYEGYITLCGKDSAAKINENEQRQLGHCTEQVIGDLDRLMEWTVNPTLYYSGTQYVYRGSEGSTPYYYYSFASVTDFYQTEDGRRPMYGLVYRCKQPVTNFSHDKKQEAEVAHSSAEVDRFIVLAKSHCGNALKVR